MCCFVATVFKKRTGNDWICFWKIPWSDSIMQTSNVIRPNCYELFSKIFMLTKKQCVSGRMNSFLVVMSWIVFKTIAVIRKPRVLLWKVGKSSKFPKVKILSVEIMSVNTLRSQLRWNGLLIAAICQLWAKWSTAGAFN